MGSRIDQLFSRKYAKEKYHRRKDNHLCVKCCKQDEQTLSGRAYCAECAEKERVRYRERYNKKRVKSNSTRMLEAKRNRDRYNRLKAEHRCTKCGQQDERTLSGRICCAACAEKVSEMQKARLRENKNEVNG